MLPELSHSRSAPVQDRDHTGRGLGVAVTPGILGEGDACTFDLAGTGAATQLRHQLDDLSRPRRAHRVSAGDQAAADVDRDAATEPGCARPQQLRSISGWAQP